MAIAIRHPSVALVDDRINFLNLLLKEFPTFLEKRRIETEIEFKKVALERADGDEEVFQSIYYSFLSFLDNYDEKKKIFYQAVLIMSISYFDSFKEKMSINSIKDFYDNKKWDLHQTLIESLDFIHDAQIVRNNIVHNVFGTYKQQAKLKEIVKRNSSLVLDDDNIYIKDDVYINELLKKINVVIWDLYKHLGFKTTVIE